jgi:hypothetical protein
MWTPHAAHPPPSRSQATIERSAELEVLLGVNVQLRTVAAAATLDRPLSACPTPTIIVCAVRGGLPPPPPEATAPGAAASGRPVQLGSLSIAGDAFLSSGLLRLQLAAEHREWAVGRAIGPWS